MTLINPLLGSNFVTGPAPFDPTLIGNSVWLDGSADFLSKTFSSGSAQTRLVFATWVQRNSFTGTDQAIFSGLKNISGTTLVNRFVWHASDDMIEIHIEDVNAATIAYKTSRVFRDIGWYHLILSIDSNETDSVQLYVNGVRETTLALTSGSALSAAPAAWGNAGLHNIGAYNNGVSNSLFLNNYVAQATMLVGQSIQASDVAVGDFLDAFTFGTNGSEFTPKSDADIAALASTAGGNSFCLDFADSADLGNDISSNNNDFTPTSMAAANQTTHTPSLQFPVLNALNGDATLVSSLGYGNRLAVGVSSWDSVFATRSMGRSGKYYYEVRMHTETSANGFPAGIHEESTTSKNWANYIGNSTATYGLGYALYSATNGFYTNGSATSITGYTSNLVVGDIVMMAVDLDNNKLYWGVNGTFFNSGDPASGTDESTTIQANTEYVFGISPSSSEDYFVNFGQDSTFGGTTTAGGNTDANGVGNFKYTVPTGFQCLASSSLTAPDYQGIDYFKPVLYTGNGTAIGSGGKAVTGVGFQPDEVWIKNRDATDDHALYDIVRGVTKQLESNTLTAESTEAEGLTAFGSDGFTVGSLAQVNTNTEDYVSWNWLGSNSTSTTSPAGTIASTSSAADAGHFSVGTYTGQTAAGTVGHGLGGIAEMVIVWDKGFDNSIAVYHVGAASDAATDYLLLNGTDAATDSVLMWNDTAPTSSVFSVGTGNNTNGNTRPKSFLAFRSVPGVCKVGSYTGNSSDAGIYLSLGFRPAWWMVKETTVSDASHDWFVADSARYTFNGTTTAGGLNGGTLEANDSTAEEAHSTNFTDNPAFDFLSDGIKLRTNSGTINATGRTYIYLAMADIGGNGTLPPVYGR